MFLLSCRVLTRGVSAALLAGLSDAAARQGRALRARFRPNERNRAMNMALRFAGFEEIEENGATLLLEQRAPGPAASHLELRGLPEAIGEFRGTGERDVAGIARGDLSR